MEEEQKDNLKKSTNVYLRFAGLGIQMGAIIGGFTWLGNFIDNKQQNATPGWTVGLALFGIFAAFYLLFKEVKNLSKDS